MTDPMMQLDGVVSQLLASQDRPTEDSIRETISAMRVSPVFDGITDDQAEQLARQLEERVGISMGIGAVVGEHVFKPWLSDARAEGLTLAPRCGYAVAWFKRNPDQADVLAG